MKELIEKFLMTWRVERERRQFQQELNDAYRKKKSNSLLIYSSLLLLLLGGGVLFFFLKGPSLSPQQPAIEPHSNTSIEVPQNQPEQPSKTTEKEEPQQEAETASGTTPPEEEPASITETAEEDVVPEATAPDVPLLEVTGDKILVYSLQNELGEIIASLEKGSVVEFLEESDDWEKIRYGDRKIGWVKLEGVLPVKNKAIVTFFSEKIEVPEKASIILVKEFLEEWSARTESRDIDRYIELYDADFTGQGMGVADWKTRKQRIFQNARFILVGVKGIQIEEETDSTLKVSFVQYYNNSDSLKSTNNKGMLLRKTPDGYRILSEYLK